MNIEQISLASYWTELTGDLGMSIESDKLMSSWTDIVGDLGIGVEEVKLSTSHSLIDGDLGIGLEEILLENPFELSGLLGISLEEVILEIPAVIDLSSLVHLCFIAETIKSITGRREPDYSKCVNIAVTVSIIKYISSQRSDQS